MDPEVPGMNGRSRKRGGSRFLLGSALFAGTLAAMYGAASAADILMDLLGLDSGQVRLAGKTAAVAAAIPAGFFLVERAFLSWSSRRGKDPGREDG